MKGGGGGTTVQQPNLPPELQQLFHDSSQRVLQQQQQNPLGAFTQGQAFRSAAPSPQFERAERGIDESRRIAGQQLPGRAALNRRPTGTQHATTIARESASNAGNVPGQFSQLRPAAQQGVGLQDLERNAVTRAGNISGNVAQAPGTFGQVRAQADPRLADLTGTAGRQVTGANIQQSPAFQAAMDAFQSSVMPTIQNSAALSGLGRTTGLQQALAAGQSQFLLPIIQGELAREERGIDRQLGAEQFGISTAADLGLQEAMAQERGIQRGGQADQFAAGLEANIGNLMAGREQSQIDRELNAILQSGQAGERAIGRQIGANQFRAGTEQAAGAQDLNRALQGLSADERSRTQQLQQSQSSIPQLLQIGDINQRLNQAVADRETQDFLRQQALAEQALFQPFGMIAPSAIGQSAVNSGGKKGK